MIYHRLALLVVFHTLMCPKRNFEVFYGFVVVIVVSRAFRQFGTTVVRKSHIYLVHVIVHALLSFRCSM